MDYTDHKLKERIIHGTIAQPYSYHHTLISYDNDIVLYNHWHEELELIFLTAGEATFYVEDRMYHLSANEALFIPSAHLHRAINSHHNKCEFYALVFRPQTIAVPEQTSLYSRFVLPVLSANALPAYHFTSTQDWEGHICFYLSQMTTFYSEDLKENELALKGLLLIIWQLFFTNYIEDHQTNISRLRSLERLNSVLEYIEEHLTQDMTLEELACVASVGKEQFCRIFKRAMETTPFVFINRKRLQKACVLLSSTNKKITDIASLCGFNNISYFNRSFLNYLACTPHEYRLRMRTIPNTVELLKKTRDEVK